MDIGAWLQSLGLEQYEAVFRANAVDAEVLPELGEADLEKLGVLLGHRKKLLKAIAALHDNRQSNPADQPSKGNKCCPRSRAPAADRDVLRSRQLDGARRAPRS